MEIEKKKKEKEGRRKTKEAEETILEDFRAFLGNTVAGWKEPGRRGVVVSAYVFPEKELVGRLEDGTAKGKSRRRVEEERR